MRRSISCFILLFSLCLLLPGNLAAGSWPNLEKAVASWEGSKEARFLTESDPLATADLLPLVEIFLKYKFAVSTAEKSAPSGSGLLVEIRRQKTQTLIVLQRASDKAVIALDRVETGAAQTMSTTAPAQSAPQPAAPPQKRALVPLDIKPVSIVLLDDFTAGEGSLALLSVAGISLYHLQGAKLQKLSITAPPGKGMRPLALSRTDFDDDGSFELAAVWAEDIHSIYEGTDSKIWSQLLTYKQQKLVELGLQPGYVRLLQQKAVAQSRGTYTPFSGPVRQLHCRQGLISTGQPLLWGGQNIFSLTPWDEEAGLAWLKPGRLSMLSLRTGEQLPGGTILEKFGIFRRAEIAVRLEEPEYRSGFEKEDKILEAYTSLPSRLVRYGANSMLTIDRGRKSGNFLSGGPEGEDRLVRLKKHRNELTYDYPFPPVSAFIIDFAIMSGSDISEVLLLLNEKEDAGGQAFILFQ